MLTDDEMLGIKRCDMNTLKEIKVKVPIKHLVNLHFAKITTARTVSDLVAQALTEYFTRLAQAATPTSPT